MTDSPSSKERIYRDALERIGARNEHPTVNAAHALVIARNALDEADSRAALEPSTSLRRYRHTPNAMIHDESGEWVSWHDARAAQPPNAPEWIPRWLRAFHCECSDGKCVACQAADLIERSSETKPAAQVVAALIRVHCPNCMRDSHKNKPPDDGEFYPVTCSHCAVQFLIDAVGQVKRVTPDETRAAPDPFASKYHELLLAVESKFPDESRHETALRYIRERERSCSGPAQSEPGATT